MNTLEDCVRPAGKELVRRIGSSSLNEALIVEIPRRNYAPTFRKRDPLPVLSEGLERPETLVFQPGLCLMELKNFAEAAALGAVLGVCV
jgi:hypothetical protein